MASLEGKTALVTGGAKRVGAEICRGLHAAGVKPVIHARSSLEDAADLAQELDAPVVTADLCDGDAVDSLLGAARDASGGTIDYVINNASTFPRTTLGQMTYDDMDTMMRLHAWAPLALARSLAATGGSAVVNLLDTRITSHDPIHFPYLTSKQTLASLTKTLAKELAPLRVNAVAPGPILAPTDGSDNMEAAIKATVLGRIGQPDEVAHAVRFLLEADYVTGQTVYVDGGRHLRS